MLLCHLLFTAMWHRLFPWPFGLLVFLGLFLFLFFFYPPADSAFEKSWFRAASPRIPRLFRAYSAPAGLQPRGARTSAEPGPLSAAAFSTACRLQPNPFCNGYILVKKWLYLQKKLWRCSSGQARSTCDFCCKCNHFCNHYMSVTRKWWWCCLRRVVSASPSPRESARVRASPRESAL